MELGDEDEGGLLLVDCDEGIVDIGWLVVGGCRVVVGKRGVVEVDGLDDDDELVATAGVTVEVVECPARVVVCVADDTDAVGTVPETATVLLVVVGLAKTTVPEVAEVVDLLLLEVLVEEAVDELGLADVLTPISDVVVELASGSV